MERIRYVHVAHASFTSAHFHIWKHNCAVLPYVPQVVGCAIAFNLLLGIPLWAGEATECPAVLVRGGLLRRPLGGAPKLQIPASRLTCFTCLLARLPLAHR